MSSVPGSEPLSWGRLGRYDVEFLFGKTITVRLFHDIVKVLRIVLSMH